MDENQQTRKSAETTVQMRRESNFKGEQGRSRRKRRRRRKREGEQSRVE